MRHVEGILEEVRRSYTSLKAQAEKAESYRTLREQIFEVELEIQLLRLKGLLEDKKKREGRLEEKAKTREEINQAIGSVNDSIAHQVDLVNSMESQLVESHKKLYQLDMEKNTRESQIRMLRERVTELERNIDADAAREKNISRKLDRDGRGERAPEDGARGAGHAHRRDGKQYRRVHRRYRGLQRPGPRQRGGGSRQRRRRSRVSRRPSRSCASQLRAITEDIVTQLDARLKEMGYSATERRAVEESIAETLQSLRIQLGGKVQILEDAYGVESVTRAEREKLVQNTLAVLKGSLEKLGTLETLFERYRTFAPSFLDEFLAPEGIITRKRDIDEQINESAAGIARLRQRNEELAKENASLREKIEEYRTTLENLRVNLARLQTQKTGIEQEIARLARERTEQEALLKEVGVEIEETRSRVKETQERIAATEKERGRSSSRRRRRVRSCRGSRERSPAGTRSWCSKEEELKQKNALLAKAQSEIEKMQIEVTEIRTEIKDLHASFTERFSRDLSEYETRIPDLQPNRDLRPRLAELREEMRKLGQVNLMAPEEFAEVKDRFDFLTAQLADLTHAREDLKKVTTEIRTESTELFLDTYNKIKKNFHTVFRRLFGGGRAELRLENPDAPLESGHRCARAAAREKTGEHQPPLRRGTIPHRRVAHVRHLHGEAVPLLPPRRDRCRAGRGERGADDESLEGVLRPLPVHRHHPQQEDGGRRRCPVRSDDGGIRGVEAGGDTAGEQGEG